MHRSELSNIVQNDRYPFSPRIVAIRTPCGAAAAVAYAGSNRARHFFVYKRNWSLGADATSSGALPARVGKLRSHCDRLARPEARARELGPERGYTEALQTRLETARSRCNRNYECLTGVI